MDRLFQGVEHKPCVCCAADAPADDIPGEHVDDKGHINDPGTTDARLSARRRHQSVRRKSTKSRVSGTRYVCSEPICALGCVAFEAAHSRLMGQSAAFYRSARPRRPVDAHRRTLSFSERGGRAPPGRNTLKLSAGSDSPGAIRALHVPAP